MSDIAQILIVDDDPHLRRAHSRLLRKSGYRVLEAATGRDALRLAKEARPGLILVDVVLPDIDGLEVCRRVKADETLAGTYVVLLSSVKTASKNRAEGLEMGADGYIVRSISNRELAARVEALLRLRQAEGKVRRQAEDLTLVNLLNDAVNRGAGLQEVVELLCRETRRVFFSNGATLYLVDRDKKHLVVQNLSLPPAVADSIRHLIGIEIPPVRIRLRRGSVYQELLQADEPRIIGDPATIRKMMAECTESKALRKLVPAIYRLLNRNSVMAAPLVSEGEAIGLLDISRREPFTESELERLATISERLTALIRRKQAEEALRESEGTARALLNAPTDAAALVDAEGIILDLNQTTADRFGRNVDDLLGSCVWDLFPPDVARRRKAYTDEVFQSGEPVRFEDEREGVWSDNAIYPVLDARGRVTKVATLTRDITGRKWAEERIAHLNAVLHAIRNVNQLIVREKDRDRLLHGVCESLIETRGYSHAWVALLDRDGEFVAAVEAGLGDAFPPLVEELRRGGMPGCARKALAQSGVVCVGDPYPICAGCPLSARYAGGAMSVRLEHDGRTYGVLVVSIPADLVEDPEERALFREVAGDIAFALHGLELEEKRRRVEDALRESEKKYRSFFQTSRDCVFITSREGRWVDMNDAALNLFGYDSREELQQAKISDLYENPADREAHIRVIEQQGFTREYPVNLRAKDGRIIKTLITSVCVKDEDGRVIGFQGTIRDITGQAQAEEALRESEERYRHLVEHSHDIICVHDLEGRILSVNQVAVDLLGYEQSALLGMNVRDVLVPRVRDEFDAYLATIREDGFASGLMLVHTRAGKERVWEYDNALRTEGVPAPVVRAMAHDVTERMRAQRALQESEERYRRLVEGSPDIVWTFSVEHGGMYTSAQVAGILGYSPGHLAEHPHLWGESVHPDDRDRVAQAVEDFAAGGELDVEYRIRDSEGNWHWFRDRSIGRHVEGDEVFLDGISTDVTKRKRAEEGLQQYTERLRALRAIDGAILAAWSSEEIARAALRHLRQLVPCLGAGVLRFDFEAREILLFAIDADGDVGLKEGARLPLWGGTEIEMLRRGNILAEQSLPDLGRAEIKRRKSEISNDGRSTSAIRALQAAGVCSYVAAPLIAYGELIGVLALASESPGAFAPDHVDVAREVANQLALALHQAHLRAALEAERGRLAALVEHLPEGVLWLDGERRVQLSNPVAAAYLPVLTDGAVGDVLSHLGERSLEELLQPPSQGMWHELEVTGPPPRVFEAAAQPMGSEEKEIEGWVVLVRDVTAEREAQEQVQQQEQLAAVGQLAGGIAHDFNNLLTTIMLYAQIPLGKPHLPPDLARAFETIVDESRRAAELVQQILDFSRRSPIQTHPVDLKPFFKEALRVLERTIPESISLSLTMGPGKYVVNADPTRIQQVLMNLVLNARDAMPEGGELRVGLERIQVRPGETPPVADMPPLSSPPPFLPPASGGALPFLPPACGGDRGGGLGLPLRLGHRRRHSARGDVPHF
jgi:PAS domain S-box-containing protein